MFLLLLRKEKLLSVFSPLSTKNILQQPSIECQVLFREAGRSDNHRKSV
jgi:hypothetical protein